LEKTSGLAKDLNAQDENSLPPESGWRFGRLGLWIGPMLFALQVYLSPLPLQPGGNEVVAVALWMLIWWISEAVPLPVTALLPIVLFSLTGVMSLDEALAPYSSKIVYLFFGGFLLALGLERHDLHKRIALLIIRAVGVSPPRMILGFMLSTAILSMWISNTATAVMMLPMALSCLQLIYQDQPASDLPNRDAKHFSTALVLGIAFSASIGGMGTVIGTPPNLVMRGYFENTLGIEVSFFQWMIWAMPVMLVILVATYILLTFVIFPCHRFKLDRAEQVFAAERERLGAISVAQWRMLAVFATTALLWMSSGFLRPLLPVLPLTGKPIPLTDEVIAIVAAIALFVIPGDKRDKRALLDWQSTTRLPWGILLLFGGGLSLAGGLEKTGVIQALSDFVQQMAGGQIILLLVLLVALAIYLTEVMSNVALVQVLVPVVAAVALGLDLNPLFFAVPTTLASSCAFMLPMATPPNAIVFATGHVTVRQMIRAGFWLNAVSLLVVILGAILLLPR
jgi:sodium-dependent dicarboxylate transporter 2/3/5